MKNRFFFYLCLCLASFSVSASGEKTSHPLVVSLPGLNWALEITAPGFTVETFEFLDLGKSSRFLGEFPKTGIVMSGFFEKAVKTGDARECRAYYWAKARQSSFEKSGIRFTESGSMALVEYLVQEVSGLEIRQKHWNAYFSESGYWIDIHLSKTGYTEAEAPLFEEVLKSIRIVKNYKPDSLMLFKFGSHFYHLDHYKEASVYYQQALELEKSDPHFPRDYWLVLVDQLGMAYGMSGNLDKAKEIYRYGIEKEPEYPMFYYNYACAFAESNDPEEAIKNLNSAWKFRANMIPGEKFPEPKTDASFKKFLNNRAFQEALDKMK